MAHADKPDDAVRLYEEGATYVVMPHYIGSERVTRMLRGSIKKSYFTPAREKHLRYVEKHL